MRLAAARFSNARLDETVFESRLGLIKFHFPYASMKPVFMLWSMRVAWHLFCRQDVLFLATYFAETVVSKSVSSIRVDATDKSPLCFFVSHPASRAFLTCKSNNRISGQNRIIENSLDFTGSQCFQFSANVCLEFIYGGVSISKNIRSLTCQDCFCSLIDLFTNEIFYLFFTHFIFFRHHYLIIKSMFQIVNNAILDNLLVYRCLPKFLRFIDVFSSVKDKRAANRRQDD